MSIDISEPTSLAAVSKYNLNAFYDSCHDHIFNGIFDHLCVKLTGTKQYGRASPTDNGQVSKYTQSALHHNLTVICV